MTAGAARRCGGALLVGAAALAPACVTTAVEDDESLVPAIPLQSVVIPLGAAVPAEQHTLQEFYDGLLARLHEAHREQDLTTMQALLAGYTRDDVPSWARDRLAGFEALVVGLMIELHVRVAARLEPVGDPLQRDDIGEACAWELVLPPLPGLPIGLGGQGDADPVAFGVSISVRDEFVDGTTRTLEIDDGRGRGAELVRLPAAFTLANEPLRLPIRLQPDDSIAVRRDFDLRVDLLPGYMQAAGQRAPVRRTLLGTATATQWPRGHQAIRRSPLETFQAAVRLGDLPHFPHVRLAAAFAPAEHRRQIEAAMIDWVRLGSPEQAIVATATLRALGAAQLPVGDRDAWLAWWQEHR
jgi:hypothetical protein